MKDDDQKKQLIPNLFTAHLQILVRCKAKGAVGAVYVCALLRNWQLGGELPITVRDGAVTINGSHKMGDRRGGMSLISARSISLDSIFKGTQD
jgi:hypothetical protein